MRAVALASLVATARAQAYAPCPNLCNGHGHCNNPDRVCECFDGFFGGDCSLMSCPYGRAWTDEASANDAANATSASIEPLDRSPNV